MTASPPVPASNAYWTTAPASQHVVTYPTNWNPHALRCPVCAGVQSVTLDFYHDEPVMKTTNGERQTCRTCWGAGMVWWHSNLAPQITYSTVR